MFVRSNSGWSPELWRDFQPYRCSFKSQESRQIWIRFGCDMNFVHEQFKADVLQKYPDATAFCTESAQDSPEIFESWRRELDYLWGKRF